MKVFLGSAGVLLGCCANLYVLEHIIRYDAGVGNLATFCQFLFITLEGSMNSRSVCTRQTNIPIKAYLALIAVYFLSGATANASYLYNIPMVLMLIFRSGSLIANMILGIVFLGKRYDAKKYLSVFLVTAGITFCTLGSAFQQQGQFAPTLGSWSNSTGRASRDLDKIQSSIFSFPWAGIGFLVASVFLTASIGIFQESIFSQYGKHPREALFYTHFLTLPAFIFLWNDIRTHSAIANESEPFCLFGIGIPVLWGLIAANTILQYACVNSVFVLMAECTSLTVTLLLTLRKFLSILISAVAFDSHFTKLHWIGTGLIFLGTLLYENPLAKLKTSQCNYYLVEKGAINCGNKV